MIKILLLFFTLSFSILSLGNSSISTPNAGIMEKEITFKSTKDQTVLHGTLTLPVSSLRGVVLMLVGSGKVDRDETTEASRTASGKEEKLFKQLSDCLVNSGFATFRYDKRGVLDSKGNVNPEIWKTADREHLIADAVDAGRTLLKETNLTSNDLIILGHSEGTILATETALEFGGTVKALLLFGAQARSMKDMLHYQIVESRSKRSSGMGEHGSPEDEFKKALEMIQTSKENFAPDGKPMNWYRQHIAAPSNATQLSKVTAKKVIFQGEADPQTPINELSLFQKAAAKDLTLFRYPSLGHGFSPDKDGKPTLGPIDPKVLTDLSLYLKSNFK